MYITMIVLVVEDPFGVILATRTGTGRQHGLSCYR